MVQLPEVVDGIARTLAPHTLAHYAVELATAFHWFYDHCRVLSSEPGSEAVSQARLKLVQASKAALARTLALIGMSPPRRCRAC